MDYVKMTVVAYMTSLTKRHSSSHRHCISRDRIETVRLIKLNSTLSDVKASRVA